MAKLTDYIRPEQCGGGAERIGILYWDDDEYVLVVDCKVVGQTLHLREAREIGQWLSTALNSIAPTSAPADREIDRLEAALGRAESEKAALLEDIRVVLRGFEDGVFVRSIARDASPGWAIELFPYLRALARLTNAADPGAGPEEDTAILRPASGAQAPLFSGKKGEE